MIDKLNFYNYVVGFVDLLGQRDLYAKEGLLPQFQSPADEDAFRERVKATIGTIDDLQMTAAQFIDAATAYKSPFSNQLPEAMRGPYEEARKQRLHKQNWSDGIVYFTSLGYPDIRVPMNSVFCLLTSLGSMCLLGLAKKRPLRGGVEVAWGVEMRKGELYGCAVAKAYEIESEIAQCPRIVLGKYIFEYLRKAAAEQPKTVYDGINQRLAQISIDLLVEDMDGRPIVHYLGDDFRKYISASGHPYLYQKALEFVDEQLATHRARNSTKLVLRYEHLREYFIQHPPKNEEPNHH